jgi:hypothetical protein
MKAGMSAGMSRSTAGLSGLLALVLGLLLGPLADRAFDQAKGPALVAGAVLAGAGLVFWRARRRKRAAVPGAWMEAACPACVEPGHLVPQVAGHQPGHAGQAADDGGQVQAGMAAGGPDVLVTLPGDGVQAEEREEQVGLDALGRRPAGHDEGRVDPFQRALRHDDRDLLDGGVHG